MKAMVWIAAWTLAALFALASPMFADSILSWPEWKANTETVGQEYQRDIAASFQPDGSWTAVWLDFRVGYPALFLRAFDAADTPLSQSHPLTNGLGLFSIDLNAFPVSEPSLAPIGDGRSILVWSERRYGVYRILGAIIGPEGILAGPVTVSDDARPDTRARPRVAVSQGRGCVVWVEGGGSFRSVYGEILDLDGLQRITPLNFHIDPDGAQPQDACRIVPSADGWIVAWQGYPDGVPSPQILARAIASDGGFPGERVAVDPTNDWSQGETAMAGLPDGIFVVWTATQGDRVQILARELDAALSPVGPGFEVVAEGATVTPSAPEVVPTGADSVLVVWTAGPASHSRFYARGVELPSTPIGDFVIVDDPQDPPGGLFIPRNLCVGGGGALPVRMLWVDNREGWDLDYHARVDHAGNRIENPVPIQRMDGSASQLLPAISLFPDNRGLVVWEDFRTGGLTIFGRYLDTAGIPVGSGFRISEGSSGAVSVPATNLRDMRRNQPAVIGTSDGRAAVAWMLILGGGRSHVMLQHYDVQGNRIGNNVELVGLGGAQSPQMAALANAQYCLVWRDTGADIDGDILAHRFLSDGTSIGDAIHVVDQQFEGGFQISPAIAASGANEYVVAWLDDRRDPGNVDVFAQRLAANGTKIETNFPVSPFEGDSPVLQANPAVAAAPDRHVIVWDENPLSAGNIAGVLTILPSAKTGSGKVAEDYSIFFGTGSAGYKYPRVAMEPGGQFVVTYWDTQADSARVMAQRFSSTGLMLGVPYPILAVDGRTAAIPADVTARPDLIQYAYSDSRDALGWDIRVRRVDWSFSGEYTPVLIEDSAIDPDDAALVVRWNVSPMAAGSTFRVWRSDADDADDAGARPGGRARIVSDGFIGPIAPGGVDYRFRDATVSPGISYAYWIESASGDFAGPWISRSRSAAITLRVSGNPFRKSVRFAWSTPPRSVALISIHDVSGRLVRSIPLETILVGRGEVVWDGTDEAGRGVPAGLYWARLDARPGGTRTARVLRLR